MTIEELFAKLCVERDLTSVGIQFGTQYSKDHAWNCTVHYTGFSASGIPCSSEHAATPQDAIAKVLRTAFADRMPAMNAVDVGEIVIDGVA